MAIKSEFDDGRGVLTIFIPEKLDFSMQVEFKNSYEKSMDYLQKVIIDFSATKFLDSTAFGMLLALREELGGDDADIVLKSVNEDVKKIMQAMYFEQLFKFS